MSDRSKARWIYVNVLGVGECAIWTDDDPAKGNITGRRLSAVTIDKDEITDQKSAGFIPSPAYKLGTLTDPFHVRGTSIAIWHEIKDEARLEALRSIWSPIALPKGNGPVLPMRGRLPK